MMGQQRARARSTASAVGTPLEPRTIARTWARVLVVAGVGHVRWHDLRHTPRATLILASGVQSKVVSERLGHASAGITLDTYSHVLPGLQAAAAAQLDGVLEVSARKDATADLV